MLAEEMTKDEVAKHMPVNIAEHVVVNEHVTDEVAMPMLYFEVQSSSSSAQN